MSNRVSSLDGMKAIAAFFVVYIHTNSHNNISEILTPGARIAVPFFFMVTGYFIWDSNIITMSSKIKRQTKKLILLTTIGMLLYLMWELFKIIIWKGSISDYIKSILSFDKLIRFFLLNDPPFGGHLWYLSSMLYVLLVYYFIQRYKLFKVSNLLIPILLAGDLILGKYSVVIWGRDLPFIFSRNFLFVGLPYFLIGTIIRDKVADIRKYAISNYCLIGYIFFTFTSIVEKLILKYYNVNATRDHYFSTTLAVLCIFIYAIENYSLFRGNLMEYIGIKYSLFIYIMHPIVVDVMAGMVSIIGLKSVYIYVRPFFVYLVTLMLAVVWDKIIRLLSYGRIIKHGKT